VPRGEAPGTSRWTRPIDSCKNSNNQLQIARIAPADLGAHHELINGAFADHD
jgi:hypothetical protein